MDRTPRDDSPVDLLVIGGGLAGASSALLLKRALPDARVVIIEKEREFSRRVGEATVEVSAFFLARVLGLYHHLSHEHLSKHGLRYYFTDGGGRSLSEMSEVGTLSLPSIPSFQIDRAVLDEEVLELARREGVTVERGSHVVEVEPDQAGCRVSVVRGGQGMDYQTRWVIDASGQRALLARQLGLLDRFGGHATSAVWGYWRGALDLDRAPGLVQQGPTRIRSSRHLATNHFCGYGWWSWVIPLANGDTSIGVVYDRSRFDGMKGRQGAEGYRDFVRSRDGLREIVAEATLDLEGVRRRNNLAYRSRQYMGNGWALVGDAAAFMDPYYSPGMDHLAMTVYSTVRLIEEERAGACREAELEKAIEAHNACFQRSVTRWFDGLYRDKYELFGDAELTAAAFYMDTAMYYLGVVHPVHTDQEELRIPTLGRPGWQATLAYRVLRFANRRLIRIAQTRRELGTYGRRNVGWSDFVSDFGDARLRVTPAHRHGLALWLRAELSHHLALLGFGRAPAARRQRSVLGEGSV